MKYTRKLIKHMVSLGVAEDITNREYETLPHLETVGLSYGTYGMNAGLFKDGNGKMYAVLSRNSLLFQLV